MTKSRQSTVRVGSGLAPEIDGILDDRVWQEPMTKPHGPFVTKNKAYSETPSFVRVARAGNRLFIAFELSDPAPDKIRGTADKQDEKAIWGSGDDLVDFFIMPDQ